MPISFGDNTTVNTDKEFEERVDIKSLLERTDIVKLIDKFHSLDIRPGRYSRGKEHDSLVVDSIRQKFFWNKTGQKGNAIDFLVDVIGMSFKESIAYLQELEPRIIKYPQAEVNLWKAAPIEAIRYWHSLMFQNGREKYYLERKLTEDTIRRELLGWDGNRYVIPIWEGEPQESEVLNVALRASDISKGPKYISLQNCSKPTFAGKWHCRGHKIIMGFAGIFDFLLANQDGFPSFTIVPGQNSIVWLRKNGDWPDLFPDAEFLLLPWDTGELRTGITLVSDWHRVKKKRRTAEVLYWPIQESATDYCEFREDHTSSYFYQEIVLKQLNERKKRYASRKKRAQRNKSS